MANKKLYIVGSVTGVENWEVKFKGAEWECYCMYPVGTEIITPCKYPKGLTQKEYMVLSCESVFWADIVVVTRGWENSMGTKAEIALAESFGLPILYL